MPLSLVDIYRYQLDQEDEEGLRLPSSLELIQLLRLWADRLEGVIELDLVDCPGQHLPQTLLQRLDELEGRSLEAECSAAAPAAREPIGERILQLTPSLLLLLNGAFAMMDGDHGLAIACAAGSYLSLSSVWRLGSRLAYWRGAYVRERLDEELSGPRLTTSITRLCGLTRSPRG